MQIVYGLAGSLKELENEVKNETGYRSELIDFINKPSLMIHFTQV